MHVFEDLKKEGLVSKKKTSKPRRKRNARTPWKLIQRRLSEKTLLVKVSLKNTSPNLPAMRVCLKDPSGQGIQVPEVRARDDRQKLASINIYQVYQDAGNFPTAMNPTSR